jgi:hypothetical protein
MKMESTPTVPKSTSHLFPDPSKPSPMMLAAVSCSNEYGERKGIFMKNKM